MLFVICKISWAWCRQKLNIVFDIFRFVRFFFFMPQNSCGWLKSSRQFYYILLVILCSDWPFFEMNHNRMKREGRNVKEIHKNSWSKNVRKINHFRWRRINFSFFSAFFSLNSLFLCSFNNEKETRNIFVVSFHPRKLSFSCFFNFLTHLNYRFVCFCCWENSPTQYLHSFHFNHLKNCKENRNNNIQEIVTTKRTKGNTEFFGFFFFFCTKFSMIFNYYFVYSHRWNEWTWNTSWVHLNSFYITSSFFDMINF